MLVAFSDTSFGRNGTSHALGIWEFLPSSVCCEGDLNSLCQKAVQTLNKVKYSDWQKQRMWTFKEKIAWFIFFFFIIWKCNWHQTLKKMLPGKHWRKQRMRTFKHGKRRAGSGIMSGSRLREMKGNTSSACTQRGEICCNNLIHFYEYVVQTKGRWKGFLRSKIVYGDGKKKQSNCYYLVIIIIIIIIIKAILLRIKTIKVIVFAIQPWCQL